VPGWEGPNRSSFRTIAVLTAIPILGLFGYVVFRAIYPKVEPIAKAVAERKTKPAAARPVAAPTPAPKPPGSIVLIIDDLGFEGQPIDRVMALDPDINFAILPNGNRASQIAGRLNEGGFEILVHLPMEPIGDASPGENAILTSMSDEEIVRLVHQNLRAVPYARGVNNHMGSRATADRRVMASVLGALPDGMYFVDSRTGGDSVAEAVARELNVRTAARQVFLDDVRTASAVREQLRILTRIAEEKGVAIGIGHPHRVTLDVLSEEIPNLKRRGFRFLRASAIVN
jgi:polysaccharide deacetylase 2 family uncharacterized protein YibQ